MSEKPDWTLEIAYHEAAHCVAHYIYGLKIEKVEVWEDQWPSSNRHRARLTIPSRTRLPYSPATHPGRHTVSSALDLCLSRVREVALVGDPNNEALGRLRPR